MIKKFIYFFLALGILSCTSKKEKLSEAILKIENSDSSSTKTGFNQLAELYYEYANSFADDTLSEKYLYKGFIFKYITEHWDDALKYSKVYKGRYPQSENFHRINLKLADLWARGKNNKDSAVHYYLLAAGKIEFSSEEYRNGAKTLESFAHKQPENSKSTALLYEAARFYQTCGDFEPAINAYLEVANKNPDFVQSPDALMAAGFIYWNDLKDNINAKAVYQKLCEKYPAHPLAKEAKTILDENMLGMTEMELAEYLSKKDQKIVQ